MLKKSFIFLIFFTISSFAYADFPIPYDANLDITTKPLTIVLKDNNTVTVSAINETGGSPKPMKPFQLSFKFKNGSKIESVFYKTNMVMNMGKYELKFTPTEGVYKNSLVLPKCGSGRTMWYGEIVISYKNKLTETKYVFYDVK